MIGILTIAGSDSGGGAGIQADLKTAHALGVYASTVITALTAQNTLGVQEILSVPPDFVAQQLVSVLTDLQPSAIKIGMLDNGTTVQAVANQLNRYGCTKIVIDPVLCSTSGKPLLTGIKELKEFLFPLAALITPNVPEAEVLWGNRIASERDMEQAAREIGGTVLIKGGHLTGSSDVLFDGTDMTWYRSRKVDCPDTHGTGCTLSAAIACFLAKGDSLKISIQKAKEYLTKALESGFYPGKGGRILRH